MCRLLGAKSAEPTTLEFYALHAADPFKGYGDERNPHGWGLVWYEEGRPWLYKDPGEADKSKLLPILVSETPSATLMAHVRKISKGVLKRANSHPFIYENWSFAHNGKIYDAPEWRKELRPKYRKIIAGETDSEIFFYKLLQAIEDRKGGVVEGIRDVVSRIKNFAAANFLLSDGESLYAYRDCTRKVRHFSLFYREVKKACASAECAGLERDMRQVPHVVVSSTKLTPGAWRSIPLKHLLVVRPELSVEVLELA